MPNFDKSGPEGKGSRTGRGLGDCSPSETDSLDTNRPRRRCKRRGRQ